MYSKQVTFKKLSFWKQPLLGFCKKHSICLFNINNNNNNNNNNNDDDDDDDNNNNNNNNIVTRHEQA